MQKVNYALKAHERAEAVLRKSITDSHQNGDEFVFKGECQTNGHGVVWVKGAYVESRFYGEALGAAIAFANARRKR